MGMLTCLTLLANPVLATETYCSTRSEMVEQLAKSYGELQAARGIQNSSAILEIFASKTGSWTAVITHVDGTSCIVAAGTNWEQSAFNPAQKT